MSALRKVRPTKGELLKLKKRRDYVIRAGELIERKRDSLAKELRAVLAEVLEKRIELEEELSRSYSTVIDAFLLLGSNEVKAAAKANEGAIEIDVTPENLMGVYIPRVKTNGSLDEKLLKGDATLRLAISEMKDSIRECIEIGVLEGKVEKLAVSLSEANRKVNAIRKIILPQLSQTIKYVEEKLEEEELEDFARTKKVKQILERRS